MHPYQELKKDVKALTHYCCNFGTRCLFWFPAHERSQGWLHRAQIGCIRVTPNGPTQKECCGMKAVSFSQSKDSMFGDMTAAPIPRAMTINAILFRHPWLRETLFSIAFVYLSASLYIEWRPSSSSLANAFSFYRRLKKKKNNNKDGQVLHFKFPKVCARFCTRIRELP